MKSSSYLIENPKDYCGKWQEYFHNDYPIHIEVGCGKGKFLIEMALTYPEINFIGIEQYDSVIVRALQKVPEEVTNLCFIRMNALEIDEVFQQEIDTLYLNFSDPWPKDRHAKRRLTSKEYFARYDQILKKTGQVEFKTDNQDLFTFSLESVKEAGWYLEMSTRDYHNSPYVEGNVMTEYEE